MKVIQFVAGFVASYKGRFFASMMLAATVAVLWGFNLAGAFPLVKILFENQSMEDYVVAQLDDAREEVHLRQTQLDNIDAEDFRRQAKTRDLLGNATWRIYAYEKIQENILPFVPNDKFQAISLLLGIVLCSTFLKCIMIWGQELLVGSVTQHVSNDIRESCFRNALKLDTQSIAHLGSGNLVARMTNDIEQLALGLSVVGVRLVREPMKAFSCIAIAFYINWRLTLMALLVAPIAAVLLSHFGRLIKRAAHRAMETMSTIYDNISETFDSFRVVTAFNQQDHVSQGFANANDSYYKRSMRIIRIASLTRPSTELLGTIAALMALAPGAYLVLNNTTEIWEFKLAERPMSIAELTTLYVLLAGTLDPVRKLSSVFSNVKRALAAGERVLELAERESEVIETSSPRPLKIHQKNIAFNNICFRYRSSDPAMTTPRALEDVSLEVGFGETIAVVGSNGSGKSTLLNLLPRFMDPEDGEILIDGVNIREYRLHELRSQIGLVTQDTMLFNTSVYENIRFGNPDATEAEIEEAARNAHALDFIKELENGMQTCVGPKGQFLSGGQRQRVALARAMVRQPQIVILDEATSAIDAHSEDLIHRSLQTFCQNRTVFIISHVLSGAFLDLVDRIAVMECGKLADCGTHAELLERCPEYRRLTNAGGNHRAAA